MLRKLFIFLVVASFGLAGAAQAADKEPALPPEAEQVVKSAIDMLDQGRLKETYSLVAPQIKKIESESIWQGRMISERESMGEAKNRRLSKVEEVERYADLKKGRYLKVEYETEFSVHPESREILILAPSPDGAWGLAAYRINYNRWPEAIKIILNGLFLVFFIMITLATITWAIGRVVQSTQKKKKTSEKG